jgi:hypothetical protein
MRRLANAAGVGAHEPGSALQPAANAALVSVEGVIGFRLASVAERATTTKLMVETKVRRCGASLRCCCGNALERVREHD